MFFPLAMLYGIYFTFLTRQLLGYELEEKHYNIFPPGPVFFLLLLVTEKLVKNLMEERKMVYFLHISIFFPLGPCCIWFPFLDSYGIEVHENDDFYPWLKCTFFCMQTSMILLWIILIIALSTISFFQYTFTKCPSLSCHSRLHSRQHSFASWENQQSDGLLCSLGCYLYLLSKE